MGLVYEIEWGHFLRRYQVLDGGPNFVEKRPTTFDFAVGFGIYPGPFRRVLIAIVWHTLTLAGWEAAPSWGRGWRPTTQSSASTATAKLLGIFVWRFSGDRISFGGRHMGAAAYGGARPF